MIIWPRQKSTRKKKVCFQSKYKLCEEKIDDFQWSIPQRNRTQQISAASNIFQKKKREERIYNKTTATFQMCVTRVKQKKKNIRARSVKRHSLSEHSICCSLLLLLLLRLFVHVRSGVLYTKINLANRLYINRLGYKYQNQPLQGVNVSCLCLCFVMWWSFSVCVCVSISCSASENWLWRLPLLRMTDSIFQATHVLIISSLSKLICEK